MLDVAIQPPGVPCEKAPEPRGPLDIVERHNGSIHAAIQRLRELTNRVHL